MCNRIQYNPCPLSCLFRACGIVTVDNLHWSLINMSKNCYIYVCVSFFLFQICLFGGGGGGGGGGQKESDFII